MFDAVAMKNRFADRLRHAHRAYGAVLVIGSHKGGGDGEGVEEIQPPPGPKSHAVSVDGGDRSGRCESACGTAQ